VPVARELLLVLRDIVTFAVARRRIGLIVLVLIVVATLAVSTTVTTVGPVAVYPFL
jgi:hypothetical protein